MNKQKPNMMKKIFTIAVLMALSMSGFAQEVHFDFSVTNSTGYAIYYRIIDQANHWVEATYPCQNGDNYWWGYDRPEGKLILADTIPYQGTNYILVAIGDHAFCGCSGLRGSLALPQTITTIGEGAFKGCSNLNGNLIIPTLVTHIGDEAFCDCSKLSGQLYLSDSLRFIGNKAFYHCNKLSDRLLIPGKTTHIGDNAFEQCGFSGRVMLPATLETIGTEAFKDMSAISSISTKAIVPPTTDESAFEGITRWIHLVVPYNTVEAYQNAPGWSRFSYGILEKSIWNGMAEPWTKGSGTRNDPYLIESAENLAWLSESVNQALNISIDTIDGPENMKRIDTTYNDVLAYQDTYFKLVIDIDLQLDYGLVWNSIGNKHYENNRDYCTYFCGHFDGNNHKIRNFNVNVPTTYPTTLKPYYYGLFGIIKDGTLSNIKINLFLIDVQEQYNKCIGGLVGKAINAQLINCYTSGGWYRCGHDDEEGLSQIYNTAVGGIVGMAEKSFIENCSGANILKVVYTSYPSGTYGVGGVAGVYLCDDQPNENNRIVGCSFTGRIEATGYMSEADGGGIVGLCTSVSEGSGTLKLERCFSSGVLYGNCYHWNEPKSISTGGIVGRVLAIDTLSVMNCYSNDSLSADASSIESYVGGIIGKAHPNTTLYVKNCYHAGSIISYNSGGIVVQNTNMTVIRNCYFDQSVAPDDGFGMPLDSNYMKTAAFINQLNNGSTIFKMDHEPFENNGYPIFGTDGLIFVGAEWFYEITNDDGTITYQHLQCVGDTTINEERPKVIVRSNTQYDRGEHTEVTHEYVYEKDGKVYWWNKELQVFTVLYDFSAEVGDEWEILVGSDSIATKVYEIENYLIDSIPYKKMTIGDSGNLFSGMLLGSIGHMTSFFPEKVMSRGKGYRVDGLRCYWLDGDLMLKLGDRDCDEVYQQYHNSIDEPNENGFTVYPNPANGVLFVETQNVASLPDPTYRITNPMGQTLLQGHITAETQQINIESLPAGMYFITVAGKTMKFVVK